MSEENKLQEEKDMEGRGLNEDEEDPKETLWYGLQKEMKEIFEQFFREQRPATTIYEYANRLLAIEKSYEKEGLSLEEIQEIRRKIVNGRN